MATSDTNYQNVVVMRHGDRIDNFEPLWVSTAARPWDPPLIEDGRVRAFRVGRKLRAKLGYPIHRVLVSPFLRCIQTASEVIAALSAVDVDDMIAMSSSDVGPIDQSKLKVSIEYGLCEMLNKEAIRPHLAPKDGDFGFDIANLESMFPSGMVDHTVGVYEELPEWEETVEGARSRYVNIIKTLADKYPSENLLLVTHGEGVGTSLSGFLNHVVVYEVEYCAYSELRRPILKEKGSGELEALIKAGQNGIQYANLQPY